MKFEDTAIAVTLSEVLAHLKVDPGKKSFLKDAENAYDLACSLSHANIIYQQCPVRREASPVFFIGDVEFHNKALFYNLSDTDTCFLYVITLGKEFSVRLGDTSDYLVIYYLDNIGNLFLRKLREKLVTQIKTEYREDRFSRMSPGSSDLWSLYDNRKIFAVLNDDVREIGVSLTENAVMNPVKTISGILFHKDEWFVDCFLCQQTDCQARQAKYNPEIDRFYHHL